MKENPSSFGDVIPMIRIPGRPRLVLHALSALILCTAGCKKAAVEPESAQRLTVVSGDLQLRQASRLLRAPVVLRATTSGGTGVPGATITLVVVQGGGAVDSASVKTDVKGEARVKWTLGPEGSQALLATTPGADAMRITAAGIQPSDIVIAQGNNQSAKAGAALTNSVVVRVLGGDNVPMDSIGVNFTITVGGGSIAPQSILTNAFGEATVKWTMGPVAGANTAQVRAATIAPVTISATGTP
jgi:hypothetical protein